MSLIRVSEEVKRRLVRLQGMIQSVRGSRVSLNSVIKYLLDIAEPLTQGDLRYLRGLKDSDLRKYASALAVAYALTESRSWDEVMEELRSVCGKGVDEAGDEELECAVRYLEPKVGVK